MHTNTEKKWVKIMTMADVTRGCAIAETTQRAIQYRNLGSTKHPIKKPAIVVLVCGKIVHRRKKLKQIKKTVTNKRIQIFTYESE